MKFDLEQMKENIEKRGLKNINVEEIFRLRKEWVESKKNLDSLLMEQKTTNSLELKNRIKESSQVELELKSKWDENQQKLPNILHSSVPFGKDSNENVVIKQKGDIVFKKHHFEMPIIDESYKNISGSRWPLLRPPFAKLERALSNLMMKKLEGFGFQEWSVPYCITDIARKNSSPLIDRTDMFQLEDKFLIPTSELPLVNIASKKSFHKSILPLYWCALSDCFRREAGSYGKDIKGLFRMHQFKKCEMVVFSEKEKSYDVLEKMVTFAESILEDLELPYRVILLCSGDTGLKSSKTYDIEIPIGGAWREVSSISNCESYQTRFLNTKCIETGDLLHSLNGSALAVGRTLCSLVEVFYSNEKIHIPLKLRSFFQQDEITL